MHGNPSGGQSFEVWLERQRKASSRRRFIVGESRLSRMSACFWIDGRTEVRDIFLSAFVTEACCRYNLKTRGTVWTETPLSHTFRHVHNVLMNGFGAFAEATYSSSCQLSEIVIATEKST